MEKPFTVDDMIKNYTYSLEDVIENMYGPDIDEKVAFFLSQHPELENVYTLLVTLIIILQKYSLKNSDLGQRINAKVLKQIKPKEVPTEYKYTYQLESIIAYIQTLKSILLYYVEEVYRRSQKSKDEVEFKTQIRSTLKLNSQTLDVFNPTRLYNLIIAINEGIEPDNVVFVSNDMKTANSSLFNEIWNKRSTIQPTFQSIIQVLVDAYIVLIRHCLLLDFQAHVYGKFMTKNLTGISKHAKEKLSFLSANDRNFHTRLFQINYLFLKLLQNLVFEDEHALEDLRVQLKSLCEEYQNTFQSANALINELRPNSIIEDAVKELHHTYPDVDLFSKYMPFKKQNLECVTLANLIDSQHNKRKVFEEIDTISTALANLRDAIANANEDMKNAVRVFVRVKNTGELSHFYAKNTSSISISSEGIKNTYSSSCFHDVIEDSNNENVYINSFKPTFEQVKYGYSLIFFGYGYSGSGKTYTLLGNKGKNGIIQHAFSDANFMKDVNDIRVESIFELYPNVKSQCQIETSMEGGGLSCFDIEHQSIQSLNDEVINVVDEWKRQGRIENLTIYNRTEGLDMTIFAKIDVFRRVNGRIRKTVNNDDSSRSHLFVTLCVKTESNRIGYITVVDLAGSEDPETIVDNETLKNAGFFGLRHQIWTQFYPTTFMHFPFFTFLNLAREKESRMKFIKDKEHDLKSQLAEEYKTDKEYLKYNKGKRYPQIQIEWEKTNTIPNSFTLYVMDQYKSIRKLIEESIYINESLNHLKYYLRKKQNSELQFKLFRQAKLFELSNDKRYNTDKVIHNPQLIYEGIDNPTINIIPLLKELSKKTNKTKYIMICTLDASEKCKKLDSDDKRSIPICLAEQAKQCKSTLEFATSVSSRSKQCVVTTNERNEWPRLSESTREIQVQPTEQGQGQVPSTRNPIKVSDGSRNESLGNAFEEKVVKGMPWKKNTPPN